MATTRMTVCEILVPLTSDVTKQPWEPGKVEGWEIALVALVGGFTYLGIVRGAWVDGAGEVVADMSHQYRVAVAADQVGALRAFAARTCAQFEQQCLYFQIGGEAELVYAEVA
jgi:hypothetical protein